MARFRAALLPLVIALLSGCATRAAWERFPEVASRRPPQRMAGPPVILFQRTPRAAVLLPGADGVLHLFAIDRDGALDHLEVEGDRVARSERIGLPPSEDHRREHSVDAVELADGTIRVLTDGREYRRAAGSVAWEDIGDSRCVRFLRTGDRLLCALVLDGREVSAPRRTDVSGGLILVLPVFWWSREYADKLVIAEDTSEGWVLRDVVDADTELDAGTDFFIELDRCGTVHVVFAESRGGSWFLVAGGPGGAGAFAGGQGSRLRYAAIPAGISGAEAGPLVEGPTAAEPGWLRIDGTSLTAGDLAPDRRPGVLDELSLRPVSRHFALDGRTGTIMAAVSLPAHLVTGEHHSALSPSQDHAWTLLSLCDGGWCGRLEPITADRLPDESFRWLQDEPVLRFDEAGRGHLLVITTEPGVWSSSSRMTYLERGDAGWSAPLVLGDTIIGSLCSLRLMAITPDGAVFAAWPDGQGRFLGRWLRQHENPGAAPPRADTPP